MLGMYPGDPGAPGGDFAGVVSRVPPGGASTAGLQPGDAVFGLAAGSLGSYVHASAKTVVPMPTSIRQVIRYMFEKQLHARSFQFANPT